MVYGMARRHNAELTVESSPGKGTTIRLDFPTSTSISPAEDEMASVNAHPARLRILTVDDDPLVIASLRDSLEADGHEVVAANGGREGIEAFHAAQAQGKPFAVVITDLGMPQVDGRKVAGAVKAASPATPVIMLTGWGQRLTSDGDVPAGVDRVLNKPPRLRELRAALAAYYPADGNPRNS
jgi:CheY-like chemotaxis protein